MLGMVVSALLLLLLLLQFLLLSLPPLSQVVTDLGSNQIEAPLVIDQAKCRVQGDTEADPIQMRAKLSRVLTVLRQHFGQQQGVQNAAYGDPSEVK